MLYTKTWNGLSELDQNFSKIQSKKIFINIIVQIRLAKYQRQNKMWIVLLDWIKTLDLIVRLWNPKINYIQLGLYYYIIFTYIKVPVIVAEIGEKRKPQTLGKAN